MFERIVQCTGKGYLQFFKNSLQLLIITSKNFQYVGRMLVANMAAKYASRASSRPTPHPYYLKKSSRKCIPASPWVIQGATKKEYIKIIKILHVMLQVRKNDSISSTLMGLINVMGNLWHFPRNDSCMEITSNKHRKFLVVVGFYIIYMWYIMMYHDIYMMPRYVLLGLSLSIMPRRHHDLFFSPGSLGSSSTASLEVTSTEAREWCTEAP